jgi:hypothetical protein
VVERLSTNQRALLISHIDGPFEMAEADLHMMRTRQALLKSGLLRGAPFGSIRPRQTELTERGRQAVAIILAEAADNLIRAGLLEQENPGAAMRRLQTMRRGGHTNRAQPAVE